MVFDIKGVSGAPARRRTQGRALAALGGGGSGALIGGVGARAGSGNVMCDVSAHGHSSADV